MENFRFEENKTFAGNCEALLELLLADDAEMATILRDNWETLVAVVREGKRDMDLRREFNSAISLALDSLVVPAEPKDGA